MTLDSVPELARRILHLEMELKRVKPSAGTDNAALLKRMSALEGVVARLSKATPTKPQVYTPKPAVRVPKPTDNSLAIKVSALEREVERLRVKERPAGGSWQSWTPTFGGFSTNPSGTCRYCIIGKLCYVVIHLTSSGTSNANTFTISLPVTCAQQTYASIPRYNNNGWEYGGFANIGSTVISLGTNSTGLTGWTTSGSKTAYIEFFYEVA